MVEWSSIDTRKTITDIGELLPDDDVKALSLLLTAAAMVTVASGFEDENALASFLLSLRAVRAQNDRGVH